jgi:PAS domain S-box-containing protein
LNTFFHPQPYLPAVESHQYQDLLAAVFLSAIDGILVINHTGEIEMVNTAAADLFGYSTDEIKGKNVSMLMGAEHASNHDGYINRYLRTGEARIIGIGREVYGQRKDGSKFPFRLSVGELSLPDRVLFTGVVHDMSAEHAYKRELSELNASLEKRVKDRTLKLSEAFDQLQAEIQERRRAEEIAARSREDALRALERERELGELKTRFVSIASHEFRTPLSTILSSVELLKRYTEAEQQDRRDRHIDRIKKSVIHLTDILNDFLSLGRMDEGRLSPSPEHIQLEPLIKDFVEYITPTFKPSQRIELSLKLDQPTFYTDQRFLRNILNNLASNASKYSDVGGKIMVGVECANKTLNIEVRDNGIGIPKEEQAQLFDRFFRARNADTIQGTGLGLHIVSRYLQLLNGKISFKSTEGEGTTFYVTIPEFDQTEEE